MLQKKVLHDGKQSFIEGIGKYSQSLFDNVQSEHVRRVKKIRILSSKSRWNCPFGKVGATSVVANRLMDY